MRLVKLTVYHHGNNKVQAIKAWRTITGLGIKDSKDFIDSIFDLGYAGRKEVILNMAQYGELTLLDGLLASDSGLSLTEAQRYVKPTSIVDFSETTPT